jgi:hypothetical protein
MSADLVGPVAAAFAPFESPAGSGAEAPADRGLDRYEGIDDPRWPDPRGSGGCRRWPEALRLVNQTTGELVYGRCRATNLCQYCQQLYVLETVEMLLLDAAEWAPTVWVVLTAREHLTRTECRRHLRQLLLAGRRRWPGLEWFVQVEFQRRGALHLNLLVKGLQASDAGELRELLGGRWCERVDAELVGQWAGSIEEAGGIVRYLAKHLAHGLKSEQAPPIGWRGHRTSQTRGYLVRPAGIMREEARASQRLRRALWRAIRVEGLTGQEAELAAQLRVLEEAGQVWQLRTVALVGPPAPAAGGWFGGLPGVVLAAAFNWADDEARLDEGAAAAAEITEATAGDDRAPPALPGLEAGPAQASGQPAALARADRHGVDLLAGMRTPPAAPPGGAPVTAPSGSGEIPGSCETQSGG